MYKYYSATIGSRLYCSSNTVQLSVTIHSVMIKVILYCLKRMYMKLGSFRNVNLFTRLDKTKLKQYISLNLWKQSNKSTKIVIFY